MATSIFSTEPMLGKSSVIYPRLKRPLAERLASTRQRSMDLAAPLTAEDMMAQAMEDASPSKWHLAHVTWFFETFVLSKFLNGYRIFDRDFINKCRRFKLCDVSVSLLIQQISTRL